MNILQALQIIEESISSFHDERDKNIIRSKIDELMADTEVSGKSYEILEFIHNHILLRYRYDIKESTRQREVVLVRQVYFYLALRHTPLTLEKIGEFASGRDHATVLHGFKNVTNSIEIKYIFNKQDIITDFVIDVLIDTTRALIKQYPEIYTLIRKQTEKKMIAKFKKQDYLPEVYKIIQHKL